MKTRQEYIELVKRNDATLRKDFGVGSLRLFGSVARNEHRPDSDVDVCVEMEPKMLLVLRLKNYLEGLFQTSVDVVRMRPSLNPFLKNEIEHDGIIVLQ